MCTDICRWTLPVSPSEQFYESKVGSVWAAIDLSTLATFSTNQDRGKLWFFPRVVNTVDHCVHCAWIQSLSRVATFVFTFNLGLALVIFLPLCRYQPFWGCLFSSHISHNFLLWFCLFVCLLRFLTDQSTHATFAIERERGVGGGGWENDGTRDILIGWPNDAMIHSFGRK